MARKKRKSDEERAAEARAAERLARARAHFERVLAELDAKKAAQANDARQAGGTAS